MTPYPHSRYHRLVNVTQQPTKATNRSTRIRQGIRILRLSMLLLGLCLLFTLAAYRLPAFDFYELERFTPASPVTPLAPPLPFLGINIDLAQTEPTARQAALARLRDTGFGWVRLRIDWGVIEKVPGRYGWADSDALLQAIEQAGLVAVVVLDGSPAWARAPQDQPPTANPLAPPADFHHFARFAAAFATRYAATVRFYQIWDEPNIAPHWGNHLVEPVGYAQLLKVTARAIRDADHDAVIIAAALAPTRDRGHTAIDEPYFLQRLYAAGAAPAFDVVAIQPFGFGHTPQDRRARPDLLNFGRAQLVRQAMLAAGDGATPVWAVRYGWNRQPGTPWAAVSEAKQTRFATEALTLARQEWPWLTAMGWAIDQPATPPADPMWGFALTPGLAQAFQAWVGLVGGGNRAQRAPDAVADRQNSLKRVGEVGWRWGAGIGWLLLVIGLGWRGVVLGGSLPWARWGVGYRQWPTWLRVGIWIGLGLIYYFATWPGLILLCWLVAVILLGWQPQVGLWLAAALLPFYAQHKEFILGGLAVAVAPSHALLLCLAVAVTLTQRRRQAFRGRAGNIQIKQRFFGASPERFFRHWPTLPALALGWLLLNLLSAWNVWHWPAYRAGLWDLVFMPLLGCWLVGRLVTTRQQLCALRTALWVGGVLVAVVGLWMWLQGNGTAADGVLRLVGPYFSPNGAALYLERALFIGLGLVSTAAHYRRLWLCGGLALIIIALFLTASRGAWLLALPVGLFSFGWGMGYNLVRPQLSWVRSRWLLIGAALALGLVGVIITMPYLAERMTNSASLTQRLLTWHAALQLWRDFPILGVGPGSFFWHYGAYLPIGALDEPNLHHPHNLWLEVATGWGLLGLIWLGLLLWQLWRWRQHSRANSSATRPLQAGLFAAFAAGLAHAQVDAFLVLPDLALWLWLGLALLTFIDIQAANQKRL